MRSQKRYLGAITCCICLWGGAANTQNLEQRYVCTANVYLSYALPEDRIISERGRDAACRVDVVPARKHWSTDCPFFALTRRDEIEVLRFGTGFGFWTVKLLAVNRRTTTIKTLSISKHANRDDLQFEVVPGNRTVV